MASQTEQQGSGDDWEIRELIARWAKAVREKDHWGISANHDENILMFDVPPPFLSRGLDAYMATWETFFSGTAASVVFDFDDLQVAAGDDVAFATAIGRCVTMERGGKEVNLKFRLTMGLRKVNGRWRIVHEHHSVPAT